MAAGSNLNLKDKANSNTALHNAILHYYSEAAHHLIEAGNTERLAPTQPYIMLSYITTVRLHTISLKQVILKG